MKSQFSSPRNSQPHPHTELAEPPAAHAPSADEAGAPLPQLLPDTEITRHRPHGGKGEAVFRTEEETQSQVLQQ